MPDPHPKRTRDRNALILFIIALMSLCFAYGVAVARYQLFPFRFLKLAAEGFIEVKGRLSNKQFKYYKQVDSDRSTPIFENPGAIQGINLITRIASERNLSAQIVDVNGRILHEWRIDWFELWPDATHIIEKQKIPKSRPGTHIHGAVVMPDGDITFNFEHLGLMRLDRQGKVVWRLPYQTHHSVHLHDDGNLWVCGQKHHEKADSKFPNRIAPFEAYTIIEVSPDGKILSEWSIGEILEQNNFKGLLYLGSLENRTTRVKGDVLHLNDVEPFPDTMPAGFFGQGDILISLRNINTVFVFNRHSGKMKFTCTGWFVRQHDPDFLDGNRFSVFDNNLIAPESFGHQSRIVIVNARSNSFEVYFEGNEQIPFYTDIMGKHQWLANGNLLITESNQGRAFEISPRRTKVWEYMNYVDSGLVGLVEEVQRLPVEYTKLYSDN